MRPTSPTSPATPTVHEVIRIVLVPKRTRLVRLSTCLLVGVRVGEEVVEDLVLEARKRG